MKYKLISMDFDGTLLTSEKTITKDTIKTLNELKKENYYIEYNPENVGARRVA